MAVFNRFNKKQPADQGAPDEEMKQIAAKRAQPLDPAADAFPGQADDGYHEIAAAHMKGSDPFGGVDTSGQQDFGGGQQPQQPHAPPSQPPTLQQPPSLFAPGGGAAPTTRAPGPASKPAPYDPLAVAGVDRSQLHEDDGLTDVARAQLAAREKDLQASKQRALQQAGAAAGLSGMGLSGGTSALLGDIGRTQDRGITEDIGNFTQQLKDQDFSDVQRQAAVDQLEEESDLDENHDGIVAGHKIGEDGWGDGNPDNNKDPNAKPGKPKFDGEVNFAGDSPKRHRLTEWADYTGDFTETTDHGHNPFDQYVGSDDKYDYYISSVDHKKWKVPRAKAGSPGMRA